MQTKPGIDSLMNDLRLEFESLLAEYPVNVSKVEIKCILLKAIILAVTTYTDDLIKHLKSDLEKDIANDI